MFLCVNTCLISTLYISIKGKGEVTVTEVVSTSSGQIIESTGTSNMAESRPPNLASFEAFPNEKRGQFNFCHNRSEMFH